MTSPAPSAAQRSLLILYGSQTGTARDVALRLSRSALKRCYPTVRVQYMDAYDVRRLPDERVVLFIASTTGQGETPANMRAFWRFLRRKDLPRAVKIVPGGVKKVESGGGGSVEGSVGSVGGSVGSVGGSVGSVGGSVGSGGWLSRVRFSVFGLGDSSYAIYNGVARRLWTRLVQLGATPLVQRGLGDDQAKRGYEEALDPWLEHVWKRLREVYPLQPGEVEMAESELLPPRLAVHVRDVDAQEASEEVHDDGVREAYGEGPVRHVPAVARLKRNERLTAPGHEQDVRHLVLDVAGQEATLAAYEPGDVVMVHPCNPLKETLAFIEKLGLHPHAQVQLRRAGEDGGDGDDVDMDLQSVSDLPASCSVLDLFWKYLDVFGTPSRSFYRMMVHFATDERHKEKLQELTSPEGQDDLYRYSTREARTYVEALRDFASVQVPLEYLLEFVPRLSPRSFSLASSPSAHPGELHVTLAVVKWTTPFGREKRGVCSTWLAGLEPGAPVPVWVTRGSMRLPKETARPLVMVGPGTGIAPFRSMCHELSARRRNGMPANEVIVFFGNRKRQGDFLYEEEWAQLVQDGTVRAVHTAFSRDQEHKVYVQHRMGEQARDVYEALWQRGGMLMVAGNAQKMPQDVKKVVTSIAQGVQGGSEEDARELVKLLERKGRYVVETWA